MKFNHQELSTYGIGLEFSKSQWFHLSRQFIQKGLLIQDPEYGGLKIVPDGYELLRGREKFMGLLREEEQEVRTEMKTAKVKTTAAQLDDDGRELFELLRVKRKELASRYHLPPYLIFSDKTLLGMAVSSPRVKEDLLSINGVGDAKLERYGDAFFDIIYCFRRKQQIGK